MKKTLLLLALAGGLMLASCNEKTGEHPCDPCPECPACPAQSSVIPDSKGSEGFEDPDVPPVVESKIEIVDYLEGQDSLPYSLELYGFAQGVLPQNLTKAKASMRIVGRESKGEHYENALAEANIYADGFEFALSDVTDAETPHTHRLLGRSAEEIASAFSTGEENVALVKEHYLAEGEMAPEQTDRHDFFVATPEEVISRAFSGVMMQFQLEFDINDFVRDDEGCIYGITETVTSRSMPQGLDGTYLDRTWVCVSFAEGEDGTPLVAKIEFENSIEGLFYYDFVPAFEAQQIVTRSVVVEFEYGERVAWPGRDDFLANFPEIIVDAGEFSGFMAYPEEEGIRIGDDPFDGESIGLSFESDGTQHGTVSLDGSMLASEALAFRFDRMNAYHVNTTTFLKEQIAWSDWDSLPEVIDGLPEGWSVQKDSYGALILVPGEGALDPDLAYTFDVDFEFTFVARRFDGPQGGVLCGYAQLNHIAIELVEQH